MTSVTTDRLAGVNASLSIKAPVAAATTANITLSGAQTIDGVSVVADDRVLVKDQTDGTENGIYDVKTSVWVRAKDFDGARDVVTGTVVLVIGGTVSAGIWYKVTTTGTITPGTTSIAFASVIPIGAYSAVVDDFLDETTQAGARTAIAAGTGTGTMSNLVEDTTPQLGGVLDTNGKMISWSKGANLTTASDLDISAEDGNHFDVGGPGTIAGIVDPSVQEGFIILNFSQSNTLTHSSTFLMPGAVDYVTQVDDVCMFVSRGGGIWKMVAHLPKAKPVGTTVLIEKQTLSSAATVDFTTGIDSKYDEYILTGFLLPSTDDQQLALTVSNDGGSTFEAGSNYHFTGKYARQTGVTEYLDNGGGAANMLFADDTTTLMVGNGSDEGIWFEFRVINAADSAKRTMIDGEVSYVPADGGFMKGHVGGTYNVAEAIDGIRLAFVSGNIASGTVRLLGVTK